MAVTCMLHSYWLMQSLLQLNAIENSRYESARSVTIFYTFREFLLFQFHCEPNRLFNNVKEVLPIWPAQYSPQHRRFRRGFSDIRFRLRPALCYATGRNSHSNNSKSHILKKQRRVGILWSWVELEFTRTVIWYSKDGSLVGRLSYKSSGFHSLPSSQRSRCALNDNEQ